MYRMSLLIFLNAEGSAKDRQHDSNANLWKCERRCLLRCAMPSAIHRKRQKLSVGGLDMVQIVGLIKVARSRGQHCGPYSHAVQSCNHCLIVKL
jgi:hypothetical protein